MTHGSRPVHEHHHHSKERTHVSLCSGYGGIDLGLRRTVRNLRTIAYCEIEAFAIANLVAKMEAGQLDAAPVWSDLKTFPFGRLRGVVDILSGGYPCQPFSTAGERLGKDDPRHLWPWIRDGIVAMQPGWVFFENVDGHVSLGLRDVLADLASIGYLVEGGSGAATWGLFSAEEVGAPHRRQRVFVMAKHPDARALVMADADAAGLEGDIQDAGSEGREAAGRPAAGRRVHQIGRAHV